MDLRAGIAIAAAMMGPASSGFGEAHLRSPQGACSDGTTADLRVWWPIAKGSKEAAMAAERSSGGLRERAPAVSCVRSP
jgi:hypothetical protein